MGKNRDALMVKIDKFEAEMHAYAQERGKNFVIKKKAKLQLLEGIRSKKVPVDEFLKDMKAHFKKVLDEPSPPSFDFDKHFPPTIH